MDGKVLGAAEVRQLATLESREVLLARLAGLLQASAQQAVNLLAAPLRQVATMTAALRDQKAEEPGATPAPTAAEAEAPAAEAAQGETTDTNDTNDAAAETAGAES
jgi:large subunit ribosomal protein L10